MSTRLHSYLGPYVTGRYRITSHTEMRRGCPNGSQIWHPVQRDDAFCARCGIKVADIPTTAWCHEDPPELIGEQLHVIDSEARPDGVFFLGPNVHRDGEPKRNLDDETHLDLGAVDPKAEIAWLQQAFAAELATLAEHFDNVEVKWGFHSYWM